MFKEPGIPWLLRHSLEPGIVSEDVILLLASLRFCHLGDYWWETGLQNRAVKPGQRKPWPWGSLSKVPPITASPLQLKLVRLRKCRSFS